jgi:hypothetical protein
MRNACARGMLIGSMLMASAASAAESCKIEMLTPKGNTVSAGPYTLDLGEADDRNQPTAWQGPLTTGQCSLDISIITKPMALGASRYLFVRSYSGSNDTVAIADLHNCAILWTSKPFSGKWSISSRELVLAGKSVPLADTCLPD